VAPPDAVATATIIRVVAGSSRAQGDRSRKRRSRERPDVERGDGTGDVGRTGGL
jgi:hypothetical protein